MNTFTYCGSPNGWILVDCWIFSSLRIGGGNVGGYISNMAAGGGPSLGGYSFPGPQTTRNPLRPVC